MKSARIMAFFAALWFLPSCPVSAASVEITIGSPDGGGGMLVIQREVKTREELKRDGVVIQEKDFSCGTASLATVLNFYLGQSVDEAQIIASLLEINKERGTLEEVIQRRGFSLLDLKLYAESLGFKAVGYRLDFEDLAKIGAPVIVPIIPFGFKHFVVFRGADQSRVYLADPSYGNLIQSIDEFKRDWYGFTNVALMILDKDGHKPEQHPMSVTDLDKVFVGKDEAEDFRREKAPVKYFIPGEY
jgi:uncharacterized protein